MGFSEIKNERLNSIAMEIINYPKLLGIIVNLYKKIGIDLEASTKINFRDSLIHYKKMYKSTREEELYQQEYAIYEHLNRGIKDTFVFFIQELFKKIEKLYQNSQFGILSEERKNEVRIINHKFKNIVLDIRLNNMIINRIIDDEKNEILNLLYESLEELALFLKKYKLLKNFKQLI